MRREVRAAEAQCAKAEALDIELAALPLPSYSCIQPDGQSAIVTKSSECDAELARRETMRARVLADTRVTVRHVSDAAWVERELSEVIVHVSEEEEEEEDEKNGGGRPVIKRSRRWVNSTATRSPIHSRARARCSLMYTCTIEPD